MTGTLFDDEDFRYELMATYITVFVAKQIRLLRIKRGWTQAELAEKAGLHQNQIAALESYQWPRGSPTLETLRKVSRALGVRLQVSFETWGSALQEILGGSEWPVPVDFEHDPVFNELLQPPTSREPKA